MTERIRHIVLMFLSGCILGFMMAGAANRAFYAAAVMAAVAAIAIAALTKGTDDADHI